MLDRPELAGTEETHLDFVDHQQDAVAVEHLLQFDKEILGRDHVPAGALNGLDVERGVFGLAGFRVPYAVIFALKQPLELPHAGNAVLVLVHALGAAEVIRKRQEMRTVAEMTEAAAIAIGRCNRRSAQRAAVIAAFERKHQALAVAGVAHELERILDRLRSAYIEMHATLAAELRFSIARDHGGEFDLLAVQILARDLRQPVDLALERVVETAVGVAEIDGRVPHLQVEILPALGVVEIRSLATVEDLRFGIVNRVAVRAVDRLELQQFGGIRGRCRTRFLAGNGEPKRWSHGSCLWCNAPFRPGVASLRSNLQSALLPPQNCRTRYRQDLPLGSARRGRLWRPRGRRSPRRRNPSGRRRLGCEPCPARQRAPGTCSDRPGSGNRPLRAGSPAASGSALATRVDWRAREHRPPRARASS